MKHYIWMILTVSLCLFSQAGCGTKDAIYLETPKEDVMLSTEEAESSEECDSGIKDDGGDGAASEGTNAGQPELEAETTEKAGKPETESQIAVNTGQPELCYVHVCGAVREPGVYVLASGSRVYEAVTLAGGLAEEAYESAVNQAAILSDGQMLYIPTEEEVAAGSWTPKENGWSTPEAERGQNQGGTVSGTDNGALTEDGRLDINTASLAELMNLSGIGKTKAEGILAYRKEHGGFSSVEEIMQVDGIKEGLYNRIKDDITVKN